MTKKEAIIEEKEFIIKREKKEINITEMTFKDLYEEFFEYKNNRGAALCIHRWNCTAKLQSVDGNKYHYKQSG